MDGRSDEDFDDPDDDTDPAKLESRCWICGGDIGRGAGSRNRH